MSQKDDFIKKLTIYFNEMDFESQIKTQNYFRIMLTVTAVIILEFWRLIKH